AGRLLPESEPRRQSIRTQMPAWQKAPAPVVRRNILGGMLKCQINEKRNSPGIVNGTYGCGRSAHLPLPSTQTFHSGVSLSPKSYKDGRHSSDNFYHVDPALRPGTTGGVRGGCRNEGGRYGR